MAPRTRKRRCLISAAILASVVVAVLGVLVMLPPQPGVTKENFNRIEVGVTGAEAEEHGKVKTAHLLPLFSSMAR